MEPLFAAGHQPRIALIAGEASGDILGASLMEALRQQLPDARFAGIGGKNMLAQGFHSVCPMDLLSVNGYVEVLRRLPSLLRLRRQLIRQLVAERPDIVIGIDAPDFNLALEKACRKAGIRTMHYVSPSIWAWRRERIHAVQQAADHVLCLFPMEPPLYEAIGMPATFVGHPLADQIPLHIDRAEMRKQLKLPLGIPVVAMLPGSRQSEIRRLAPVMIAAARLLLEGRPDMRFLVPLATRESHTLFQQVLFEQAAQDLPLSIMYGRAQSAMAAADVVLVKSGTATLETALMKRPMVITYKVAALTAWMMKRKAYLPWVGLPNVLAGETIVPEFLQQQATAPNLAQAVAHWLDDTAAAAALAQRFEGMHQVLRQNAGERAAAVVMQLMKKKVGA